MIDISKNSFIYIRENWLSNLNQDYIQRLILDLIDLNSKLLKEIKPSHRLILVNSRLKELKLHKSISLNSKLTLKSWRDSVI